LTYLTLAVLVALNLVKEYVSNLHLVVVCILIAHANQFFVATLSVFSLNLESSVRDVVLDLRREMSSRSTELSTVERTY